MKHKRLKVMTILGTRPEIIRLSKIIQLLDQHVDHLLVHTGQNYDYELNEVFFSDLNVRKPDYFMQVDTRSLGAVYGNILVKTEEILAKEKPDAVLILGDTNSSIACIMAKRKKIPIYHMEAGNRCFDLNVPEEINRKIIDHISDFNICYTEHARRNLIAEGLPARRTYVSGSPLKEVLDAQVAKINSSKILEQLGLEEGSYFLTSMHREENVDNSENLKQLLESLEIISLKFNSPVIVSTHPRTRDRLEKLKRTMNADIRFLKPFGFLDYICLQKNAKCVISDSGTISEESAILDFSAVTIRNSMERPEAMDHGTIILTGLTPEVLVQSIILETSQGNRGRARVIPHEYTVSDVSFRMVKLILGTSKLSNRWSNIRQNDLM